MHIWIYANAFLGGACATAGFGLAGHPLQRFFKGCLGAQPPKAKSGAGLDKSLASYLMLLWDLNDYLYSGDRFPR